MHCIYDEIKKGIEASLVYLSSTKNMADVNNIKLPPSSPTAYLDFIESLLVKIM
jgi:hypothetical protein